MPSRTRWTPAVLRREALAGLVVALALIPEAISFSIIAGVDPRLGLFASVTMAISIAIVGGRPAMISAATGAVALVVAPVAREHGVDYLIATVLLAGIFQVVLGLLGVARLMKFIPRSVMTGFVNALAILIASAQVPYLTGVTWTVYPAVALGILVIAFFPRLTTAVPAPLVAVAVVAAFALALGLNLPDVGDEGALPTSLPVPGLPEVPLTWVTLQIIAPYALGMAVVGLLESLLTASLVDEITDTRSDKVRESWGQGVANLVTGVFGGMGGCAVIGQTMINVRISGARTRLSTFLAGAFLLALVLGLGDVVAAIPMAALVAIMIMVSFGAFDWHSVKPATLRRMPRSETAVMVVTVVTTLATHNLAIGVFVGVLTAAVLFARRVATLVEVVGGPVVDDRRVYTVRGELFFASSNDLVTKFDYADDPAEVVLDLSGSHVWDASTVAALDAVETKYSARGKHVEIVGLNTASAAMRDRLAGHFGA